MHPNRVLLRAGFLLFALALVTGFAVPAFLNQRMAVNSHVSGVLNALLLVALALAWEALHLGAGRGRLVRGLFLYGTYANWGSTALAAAWGTSRLTPQGGGGFTGAPWQEAVVATLQVSLALAMLLGALLVLVALRPAGASGAAAR